MLAENLDAQIKRVAPIRGVSIGNAKDRSTWRIDFADEASEAQREAAAAVVASFDPVQPERAAAVRRLRAQADARIATRPIHAEKFAQALAYQATPDMPISDVPLIDASIGFDGDTAADVAAVFVEKYTASVTYAAAVERARLMAERAIRNASTVQGVQEAARAVAWPTP